MWPVRLKGLIRCKKEGSAVEISASGWRRDQPMLAREARKEDSLEVDMFKF